MARVEGKKGLLVGIANRYSRRQYGREMETTDVIANSRPNMLGWGMFEWWHERSKRMPERLKVLAATKAATVVGCAFCIDIGTALGREAGVSEEQLRDFHRYRDSDAFSDEEKLVMEYAEAMSQTNVDVPDQMFDRLRAHFDSEQIVELTAAIAIENFRARFNNALDVAPAGFSEGQFCPMPERSVEAERAQETVVTGAGSA
jgi:4-carboxymuconolactone decarboxylase